MTLPATIATLKSFNSYCSSHIKSPFVSEFKPDSYTCMSSFQANDHGGVGAVLQTPPTSAPILDQFGSSHRLASGGPPPIIINTRPTSTLLPPPIPSNRPTTPSHWHPQPFYGPYPPPPATLGPEQPFPQYYQHPIGAPSYQGFYPPPFGLPLDHAPYTPQPEPTLMRMPEPFQSPPQSPAYSPVPHSPTTSPPYFPSHTQWYLGTEIPHLHSQRALQGHMKVLGYDPKGDAQAVTNATKGRTLDKKEKELLIRTLVPLSALEMDSLSEHYQHMTKKTLLDVLPNVGILNDYFGMGIHGLAAGPLAWDVELVGKALAPRRVLGGLGTDETLLNELILARPTSEIRILTEAFRLKHGEIKGNITKEVKDDLSLETARMFELALDTTRPDDTVLDRAAVEKDVDALYHTGRGSHGKEKFYEILVKRSFSHTLEIISVYDSKHGRLSDVVKRQYSGHMKEGLLFIVNGAENHAQYGPGVWRDAQLIYNAMEGKGTNNKQLVWRLVRAHWDASRMAKIKEAYRVIAKEDLARRVRSETSGAYRTLLVALVDGIDG